MVEPSMVTSLPMVSLIFDHVIVAGGVEIQIRRKGKPRLIRTSRGSILTFGGTEKSNRQI